MKVVGRDPELGLELPELLAERAGSVFGLLEGLVD